MPNGAVKAEHHQRRMGMQVRTLPGAQQGALPMSTDLNRRLTAALAMYTVPQLSMVWLLKNGGSIPKIMIMAIIQLAGVAWLIVLIRTITRREDG